MRQLLKSTLLGLFCVSSLIACGGGGGGGAAATQTTKLYLFGNLSTNFNVASVTTTLTVPNFSDYSSSASDINNTSAVRGAAIKASGPVLASSVIGSYDKTNKLLSLTLVNASVPFKNMSASKFRNAGKGTEIGTLVTASGTTLPTVDLAPIIGQSRPSPFKSGNLHGCAVNYAP